MDQRPIRPVDTVNPKETPMKKPTELQRELLDARHELSRRRHEAKLWLAKKAAPVWSPINAMMRARGCV